MSSAVSIDSAGTQAEFAPASSVHDASTRAPARTRWWVELLAIAWLCWLYDATTDLAPLRLSVALGNARGMLHVEQVLHIDPELTLDRWLAGHHTLGLILSDYYDNAHFIVTLGLLGFLWWRRADIYRPLRNTLVLINVIGFVIFWRFPVAPPRMLDGFTDVVAASHAFGSWHTGSLASHANQLAAMPSLHMAWAGWCTVSLWRISRRTVVRLLAVLYPCVTALAVLATGNHFLLDIVGGLLVLGLSLLLVGSPDRLLGRIRLGRVWQALRNRRDSADQAIRAAK
ncbi:MAG TPA: phosphatase PAP2 family protein [Solirubrobacteraceae bacterium]|nr:phosphatase PAP2 family protein [Solirubrobacteraceae bacterium]